MNTPIVALDESGGFADENVRKVMVSTYMQTSQETTNFAKFAKTSASAARIAGHNLDTIGFSSASRG